MKFNISKEWCLAAAELEEGTIIGAGDLARNSGPQEFAQLTEAPPDESRIAFGQFITLARRRRQLSVEALAEATEVDIGELLAIEQHDSHFAAEPRTVYQLANYFSVSRPRLMELAGLMRPKNSAVVQEAMKFAARSVSVAELTEQEKVVLEGLVTVLTEQNGR